MTKENIIDILINDAEYSQEDVGKMDNFVGHEIFIFFDLQCSLKWYLVFQY